MHKLLTIAAALAFFATPAFALECEGKGKDHRSRLQDRGRHPDDEYRASCRRRALL